MRKPKDEFSNAQNRSNDMSQSEQSWERQIEHEYKCADPVSKSTIAERTVHENERPGLFRLKGRSTTNLVGLALSGGGVRSSTFSLGLLQSLDEVDLLDGIDYLSTVSGGGYAGAFWTAWRKRAKTKPDSEASQTASPVQSGAEFPRPVEGRAEAPEMRHVREYSNFLTPRMGLLKYDTGRLIAAAVSGFVPAFAASMSLLILVLLVWHRISIAVFMPTTPAYLSVPVEWLEAKYGVHGPRLLAALSLALLTALVLGFLESKWKRLIGARSSWIYFIVATTATILCSLAWYGILSIFWRAPQIVRIAAVDFVRPRSLDAYLFLPALAWATVLALLVIGRMLISWWNPDERAFRSSYDRVGSRLFLIAGSWIVITLIWIGGLALATIHGNPKWSGLFASIAVAIGIFKQVQQIVSNESKKTARVSLADRLKQRAPRYIAYAILLALGCVAAAANVRATEMEMQRLVTIICGCIILFTLLFFNPNEVGLHSFYRSRLTRAYLGASNPNPTKETDEQKSDDFKINELVGTRPIHLICCAANDLAPSDSLASLNRGAVSAVLSPSGFTVGNDAVSWDKWLDVGVTVPKVGTAITASGAAFNSLMGSKSIELGPATTVLMTMLNLRLGVWLPSPRNAATSDRIYEKAFPGIDFFRELIGSSRVDGASVHLSDGGHFENTGIYELVRRRCRYILAADCGADPDVAFDDIGNMIRRVREDFGVEIDIDLTPLKPRENSYSLQSMVAGDIHYPDGDVGTLLVVKPTMTGNEPSDVAQYRERNRVFPHETTGDQFYDEAQWESYRRLGLHVGRSAFRELCDQYKVRSNGRERIETIFGRARRRWIPSPVGFESRFEGLSARLRELDRRLADTTKGGAPHQIFPGSPPNPESVASHLIATAAPSNTAIVVNPVVVVGEDDSVRNKERNSVVLATPLDEVATAANALSLVRECLLVMEGAFTSENLAARYDHPSYLGIINYFLRWSYTSELRFWWPMLRSLHDEAFVAFAETRLGLRSAVRESARSLDVCYRRLSREDYAMNRWLHDLDDSQKRPQPDEKFLSLEVMSNGRCVVQIGQIRVKSFNAGTLIWEEPDFYIAPGLWGVGLGEIFLKKVIAGVPELEMPILEIVVEFPEVRRDSLSARNVYSYTAQLYRSQGFFMAADGIIGGERGQPLRSMTYRITPAVPSISR